MAYLAALAALEQAAPEPRARRRAGRQGRSSALPISTRLEMGARIGAWVEEQAGAGIHYTRMPWGALATNMFNLTPSNAVACRLKRVYAEWAGKSKAGRLTPAGAGAEDRQQRRRRSDDPQGVRVDSLRPGLGDGGRPGRSGGRRRRPAPAHQPVRPWRRGPVPQTVAASRPAGDVRHGGSESARVRDHFA
ncbi:unnamed protein product [Prorocentrum cordatum]|uniref:Uncharacterized protein n=2 Tax=Prorocentrum cordatum TaxID=2364126 RepID=A0ABN9RSF3_9DINO|nr:unnamed protein product [Polarella glacialis]